MTVPEAIPVERLLTERRLASLDLEVAAGSSGLANRLITNPRIQKPGLALAGYLEYVKPGRLQILGESEYDYLATFAGDEANSRLKRLTELDIPCIVSTKSAQPPEAVLAMKETPPGLRVRPNPY